MRSLRYYEECGLIEASRSPSGQRHYGDVAVDRVLIVRQLLAAGLGTAAISDVLPCMAEPDAQTSRLTARLVAERDRLADEITRHQATKTALDMLIQAAPPLGDRATSSLAAHSPDRRATHP